MSLERTQENNYVGPEVREGSKWLIVAEAPGEHEVLKGRPLVGPTGRIVDGLLNLTKLYRDHFDLANVLPWRPPKNKIEEWTTSGDPRIKAGQEELELLIKAKDYTHILGFGAVAMEFLTGKKKIYARRGSIYDCLHNEARVLSTIHPVNMFNEPKLANIIIRDVFKFKRLIDEGDIRPRERRLVLFPTRSQIDEFMWEAVKAPWMAVDIECDTTKRTMSEIGFALSADYAICIPYNDSTRTQIEYLLGLPNRKVFHNAAFDVAFLRYCCGIGVEGVLEDTMLMHHSFLPELPKDLGFLVSIYTDEPYFKDLGAARGNEDGDLKEHYRYNALDTSTTAELYPILSDKLDKYGLTGVYESKRAVLPESIRMACKGVRYDVEEGERFAVQLERSRVRWQAVLDGRIGHEINVYSHPQVCKLLYEELKLPIQWVYDKKKRGRRITTGQGKLLSLYPTLRSRRLRKILKALLMVRRARKMLSTYVAPKRPILGPDNRIRTSLNVVGAETGRWSASMFLINMEGTNLQTVPPSWKKCFIADEGKLLGYADYAQIEAQLVAYDAQDLHQIRLIESGESDLHYENAARILGKPVSEVSRVERQVVGKSSHALNYDVGPATLAEFINKKGLDTGIWVTTQYTAGIKDQYRSKYRGVLRWQQRTWDEVRRTGKLTNHLGRTRIFLGPKKGDYSHITRGESLAFVPQSDVPDILDIAIVKIINDKVMQECGIELLLQVHDALLVQGDEDKVEIWKPRLADLMILPLLIHGRTCRVPVDVNTGVRWSELT